MKSTRRGGVFRLTAGPARPAGAMASSSTLVTTLGQSVSERREPRGVVWLPSGRHHDGAHAVHRAGFAVLQGHVEHARLAGGLHDRGGAVHFDAGMGEDGLKAWPRIHSPTHRCTEDW